MTTLREGDHVRVRVDAVHDGAPHPHAGKTGIIAELLGVRVAIGKPRAMVKIDAGCEHAGNTMVVSLEFLEKI